MEIAKEKGFEVSAMEAGEEDLIHIFVSGHPKISPSYMVTILSHFFIKPLILLTSVET